MKRFFVLFTLCVLAMSAQARSFRINDIRLEGLQRVSASPVFAALPVQVGEDIDSEGIREIIRELFKTGYFTNVQVARENGILIIVLQERPSIKKIEIDGNKAIKTEQLEEVMNDNGLKEGEILQQDMLQAITRELERQYVAQARYGATVESTVKELPHNMVEIKIDVDEGKAARIKHINIVGNNVYSDEQLLDLFEISSTEWNSFFTSSDKYAKERLTGDIETLESFYLDRGYLDFEVLSTQISISPDKTQVFITLNIQEGEVYSVNKIDIAGDPIIPAERARQVVLLREGKTFSQAFMTETSEYMKTMLGNAGYTNAKVEGIPAKNQEDHTVDVTFFIDPGKRVYVRRINFRGNTKTADDVLRREMRQQESASASNARIQQSKVRLERLGFFKEVNVETSDVPGTDDQMDVEYTVEEQSSGTIQATVGYAQTTGLNLGVSIQQNNWLGSGKQVGFSVNKNTYQTRYAYNYTDPYFTPDGVSRGFSAYYLTRDYERINVFNYSSDTYGGDVKFGYPISEISRVGFGLGYVHQKITTGSTAPQEIISSPKISDYSTLSYITQEDYETLVRPNMASGRLYPGELSSNPYEYGVPLDDSGNPIEFNLEPRPITEDQLLDRDPGFIDKYGEEFNSGTISFNWSRFTLNRGILATRGSSQQLMLEATLPSSEMEYFKLTYRGQIFFPLYRDFTLRLRTRLGYGDGYGDMDELPFFENFYAGGFGSVRGFERSSLGPKGTPAEQYMTVDAPTAWEDHNGNGEVDFAELTNPDWLYAPYFREQMGTYILCENPSSGAYRCDPGKLVSTMNGYLRNIGGNMLTEVSAEILLPIPFIEDTRSMQLVAFVDAGNTFSSSCRDDAPSYLNCYDISVDHLSSSAGLGFTWISGFGPMTFSYSVPLHKNPNDEVEGFQFSFGTGF